MTGRGVVAERDLYKVLDVDSRATDAELRAAFRRAAAKHHPDLHPGDARAALRFKRINAAYQVLSDPVQRRAYDKLTNPIEDDSATPPSQHSDPPPKSADAPRSRASQQARPDPVEPPPERFFFEFQSCRVTSRKVAFLDGRVFPIEDIRGANATYRGRDAIALGGAAIGGIVGAWLFSANSHSWALTAAVLAALSLVRFLKHSPSYTLTLETARGPVPAFQTSFAARANEFVDAVHVAVAQRAPAQTQAAHPKQKTRSKQAVAADGDQDAKRLAFAVVGVVVTAAVVVAVVKDPASPKTAFVPSTTVAPPSVPEPPPEPTRYYVVKPGDGWMAIAAATDISIGDLLSANDAGLTSHINPGDKLALPAAVPSRGAASPRAPATATVAPLLAGERPPIDQPNYFDARELGTGSLAAFTACVDALDAASPDADEATVGATCTCVADAARKYVRAGKEAGAAGKEVRRCMDAATNPNAPSPFAAGLTPTTMRIAATYGACLDVSPPEVSLSQQAHLCACITDAVAKGGAPTSEDFRRCDIASTYAANTGQNLTARQFGLLARPTSGQSTVSSSGPPFSFPMPQSAGAFIPYPGNGLGPSPCADGAWSNSRGSGTCSHHGGISGSGRRHRRH